MLTRFVLHHHIVEGGVAPDHYDLRLENEKNNKVDSYALPNGIPDIGQTTHLAIYTFPHTKGILNTEGNHRRANGQIDRYTIVDKGFYQITKETANTKEFVLNGRDKNYRFVLIKTKHKKEYYIKSLPLDSRFVFSEHLTATQMLNLLTEVKT